MKTTETRHRKQQGRGERLPHAAHGAAARAGAGQGVQRVRREVLGVDPQTLDGQRQNRAADPAHAPGAGAGVPGGRRLGGGAAAQAQRGARRAVAGGWRRATRSWARRCGHRPLSGIGRARWQPCGVTAARGPGPVRPDAGPSPHGSAEAEAGSSGRDRKPPTKPSMRREYPDLVTREPAEDDEEVFGDAWPLIVEWRELKDTHPNEGKSLSTG